MADSELGTARGSIEISASTLSRAIASLDTLGNKMLVVGVAAGALVVGAVKSAADFEQQMSRFQAATKASGTEMDELRKKAMQLGRDSAYGATEVAKAFAELAYAGASTKEIVQGLGDATVYLAAAGEIPLADASRTLINTMRQFHIPAKDAVSISDELARAANASTIDVTDLTTSLRYAGPVAAAVHIPFRQVAETLAILGNEGIRGSTAGTSLRGILIALTPTSEKAANMMKQLGLITKDGANQFFDATGKIKSMSEIAQILQDHTKNLTDEQKKEAFTTIFQRRAMASALALADGGAAAYDKLAKSAQYNTTAQEIMRKKLDNLKGSLKILKSSVETLAITLGEYLQPVLKGISDALRDVTNWFQKQDPWFQQFIVYGLLAFAAMFGLFGILGKLTGAILRWKRDIADAAKGVKYLAQQLGLLQTAEEGVDAAAAANPYVLIALAVLAIIAALVALWVWWDKVKKFLMDNKWVLALIIIFAPFIAVLIGLVALAKWVEANWTKIWNKIREVAREVWFWLRDAAFNTVQWLLQAWKDVENFFNNDLIPFFKDLPSNIGKGLEAAGKAILDFIKKIPTYIQNLPLYLQQLASTAITWLVQAGIWVITGLWNGMTQAFILIANFLIGLPAQILAFFGAVGSWLLGPGLQLLIGFLNGIIQGWFALMEWIVGSAIPWLLNAFIDTINWLFTDGLDLLQGFWNGALDVWNAFIGWVGGLIGNILTAIGNLIGTLLTQGQNLIQGLWNGATGVFDQMISWVSGLPDRIFSELSKLGTLLIDIGHNAIQGLWNGMKSLADDVLSWAKHFAQDVVDFISNPLSILSPSKVLEHIGLMTMKGFQIGLEKGAVGVFDSLDQFNASLDRTFAVTATAPAGSGTVSPNGTAAVSPFAPVTNVYPSAGMNEDLLARKVARLQARRFREAIGSRGGTV